jgi:hypothetical protein
MAESHKSLAQGNTPCGMDDPPSLSSPERAKSNFLTLSMRHPKDIAKNFC